jgi:hypothetical protein
MRKLEAILPLTAMLCAAMLESAAAQSCGDQAARFAQQYGLSSPAARTGATGEGTSVPGSPATVESRGVTETQPPPSAAIRQNGSSVPKPADLAPPKAAVRQSIENAIAVAEANDQAGDTAGCQQFLNDAQRMAREQR